MPPCAPEPIKSLTPEDVVALWPQPDPDGDKYSRGVVGIDTGSARYPGAAILSVLGALWSGAGFIRYVGTETAKPALLVRAPSITYGVGRVQAWCLGSGWDESAPDAPTTLLNRLLPRLRDNVPCVLDAGALSLLRAQPPLTPLPKGSLLTPHAGELARLLGVSRAEVSAQPLQYARQAAQLTQTTVLLKGPIHYAVSPDGAALTAVRGPAWTAQAGSGDVLAGVCATLLASGVQPLLAAALAASAQALIAAAHPGPIPPDVLITHLPALIASHNPPA
ncbi:MAG: NAD(P)H-hydrate dehydratase [Propionibacteriaceae bacterium]|jgi:hydroxyethylthiazole kinase-like uncharacterized protein yjeF|nr:NAD(P)H-hydrate dehydratase [Propionibacteriaceae bacterium]